MDMLYAPNITLAAHNFRFVRPGHLRETIERGILILHT
ncbi:hypothetical protein Z949_1837 [Sulfitobacter guttiformis KCTC 32187]|nr:hypothetical protein Z949_1837 [Sulfitobacter guttiformis KCTC 32187]